jgi:hypothetical protein
MRDKQMIFKSHPPRKLSCLSKEAREAETRNAYLILVVKSIEEVQLEDQEVDGRVILI